MGVYGSQLISSVASEGVAFLPRSSGVNGLCVDVVVKEVSCWYCESWMVLLGNVIQGTRARGKHLRCDPVTGHLQLRRGEKNGWGVPKYFVVRKWDVYSAWSLFPNLVYKSINFISLTETTPRTLDFNSLIEIMKES